MKYWGQKEEIYNYLWGTESFQKFEPDSESFIPDGYVTLVFNKQLPYVSSIKAAIKRYISYFVLFFGTIDSWTFRKFIKNIK